MHHIDLYFRTTTQANFYLDLGALGLHQEVTVPAINAGQPAGVHVYHVLPEGVNLDYVGELELTPAIFDDSTFPPVVTTPATYYPGERANLRLTGPLAESRATALAAAQMPHTQLLAPADVPPSQMRWAGGSEPWNGQASVPPPPPDPALDLAAQKTRLLARLAQRRWEVETGGITVAGVPVRTDRESTAMLGSALEYLSLAPAGTTVPWKSANGTFVTLDLPTLQSIALAVGQHVQTSFAHEATLASQITAAPDATTLQPLAVQVEAFTP